MPQDFATQRWYEDKISPHEVAFGHVRWLDSEQSYVEERNKRFASLYEGRRLDGFDPGAYRGVGDLIGDPWGSLEAITYNVIRSCIDTVFSKLSLQKPRPLVLTSGGDFELRSKAKRLEKFLEGEFARSGAYRAMARALKDTAIFGTGVVKVFEEADRVCCERVFPGEVLVDEQASLDGKARVLYQRKHVSKEILTGLYPRKRSLIESADLVRPAGAYMGTDLVTVLECWHLPSSPGGKDGRRMLCTTTTVLEDEVYTAADFPFVIFRWSDRVLGFYGQGLAEELHGIQLEINRLLQKIQQSMHLLAQAWIMKPKGSMVQNAKLSNQPAIILEYSGTQAPHVEVHPTVPSEVFQHLETLYRKAFEIAGVSQLSASSVKPAGIESGIAIRMMLDTESQRFAEKSATYEAAFIDLAEKFITLGRQVYGKKTTVKWAGKTTMEEVPWSEVDLEEDRYSLRLYPANMLPVTPAGRLATVQDLMQAGLIDQPMAKSLLDFPDLQRFQDLDNAGLDDIDATLEKMLANGDYIAPEPYQDLGLAMKRAQHFLSLARLQGAPDDRLALLAQYLDEAYALMQPVENQEPSPEQGMLPPPGMPPMAPPPGMPPAEGMPLDAGQVGMMPPQGMPLGG